MVRWNNFEVFAIPPSSRLEFYAMAWELRKKYEWFQHFWMQSAAVLANYSKLFMSGLYCEPFIWSVALYEFLAYAFVFLLGFTCSGSHLEAVNNPCTCDADNFGLLVSLLPKLVEGIEKPGALQLILDIGYYMDLFLWTY